MKLETVAVVVALITSAVVGAPVCKMTWEKYDNTHVTGLVRQGTIRTEQECKSACEANDQCWNIDFSFLDDSCWHGTAQKPASRAFDSNANHWDLTRVCQAESCKTIKGSNTNAASGVYKLNAGIAGHPIEVYCEMGINDGGYTFINSRDLAYLTDADLQAMFTDTSSFLLRLHKCNGDQPYIVLKQLSQFSSVPLKLGLNQNTDYNAPNNVRTLGEPYLYFGFLPNSRAAGLSSQGLWANGRDYSYAKCGSATSNYFALFANYKEIQSVHTYVDIEWPLFNQILASAIINPSRRNMPAEYFYFMDSLFSDCGWYIETDARLDKKCITSAAIGFR